VTTLELVVGAASLLTAIAAIVGLYLTRRGMKETRDGSGERNQHLSDVVTALAESVGVQKKEVGTLSTRLGALVSGSSEHNKHLSAVVMNLTEIVGIQKKQIEALATRLDALVSEQQRRVAIAERQVLQQQQQQSWNMLTGIGKLIGWAWDRGFLSGETEDEY